MSLKLLPLVEGVLAICQPRVMHWAHRTALVVLVYGAKHQNLGLVEGRAKKWWHLEARKNNGSNLITLSYLSFYLKVSKVSVSSYSLSVWSELTTLNGGYKWQFSGWFGTPKKRPPQTKQICSKTRGNMLLEVDLWGSFLGVANHQKITKK